MKKLIITMGAFTALAAPIATVVACGNNDKPPQPPLKYISPTLKEMNIWVDGVAEKDQKISKIIKAFEGTEKNAEGNNFDKSITKEAIKLAINKELIHEENHLELFIKLIDNDNYKTEDAYYLLKSLRGAIGISDQNLNMAALTALNPEGAGLKSNATEEEKISKMKEIIMSGNLNFKEIATSIINKFTIINKKNAKGENVEASKDPRFTTSVKMAGEIIGKELIPNVQLWNFGVDPMGGNDTVKYILAKEGYKFTPPPITPFN